MPRTEPQTEEVGNPGRVLNVGKGKNNQENREHMRFEKTQSVMKGENANSWGGGTQRGLGGEELGNL